MCNMIKNFHFCALTHGIYRVYKKQKIYQIVPRTSLYKSIFRLPNAYNGICERMRCCKAKTLHKAQSRTQEQARKQPKPSLRSQPPRRGRFQRVLYYLNFSSRAFNNRRILSSCVISKLYERIVRVEACNGTLATYIVWP